MTITNLENLNDYGNATNTKINCIIDSKKNRFFKEIVDDFKLKISGKIKNECMCTIQTDSRSYSIISPTIGYNSRADTSPVV